MSDDEEYDRLFDDESGHWYYVHKVTGESYWEEEESDENISRPASTSPTHPTAAAAPSSPTFSSFFSSVTSTIVDQGKEELDRLVAQEEKLSYVDQIVQERDAERAKAAEKAKDENRQKLVKQYGSGASKSAVCIQSFFRRISALHFAQNKIRKNFIKFRDPETGYANYKNLLTGEVSWKKPLLLKEDDLTMDGEIVYDYSQYDERKVICIQQLCRRVQAHQRVFGIILDTGVIKKEYRVGERSFYYLSEQTSNVFWKKPFLLLRNDDLPIASKTAAAFSADQAVVSVIEANKAVRSCIAKIASTTASAASRAAVSAFIRSCIAISHAAATSAVVSAENAKCAISTAAITCALNVTLKAAKDAHIFAEAAGKCPFVAVHVHAVQTAFAAATEASARAEIAVRDALLCTVRRASLQASLCASFVQRRCELMEKIVCMEVACIAARQSSLSAIGGVRAAVRLLSKERSLSFEKKFCSLLHDETSLQMRTLLLERNPFCCDVDLIEMARLLEKAKERPVLRELSIRQCNISDLGCEKLANAIIESRNRTLCMINLESNCITSAGVVSISKALLHKECCIKSIRLGGNDLARQGNTNMGCHGAAAVCRALGDNSNLEGIELTGVTGRDYRWYNVLKHAIDTKEERKSKLKIVQVDETKSLIRWAETLTYAKVVGGENIWGEKVLEVFC
eukprot:g305.t1